MRANPSSRERLASTVGAALLAACAWWSGTVFAGQLPPPQVSPAMLWGDPIDGEGPAPQPVPLPAHWSPAKSVANYGGPRHVRWAVLRCSYRDSPPHPLSLSATRRVFEKPDVGVFAFFDRASREQVSQEIAWVVDVQLPLSLPDYWQQHNSVSSFLDATTGNCLAGANRALDGITGVAVFFNDNIDCCAYGSRYQMPLPDGDTRDVHAIWIPALSAQHPGIVAHEVVHSFGVGHSDNSDGDWDTTDNAWDLMSNAALNVQHDSEIGPLPRGMHQWQRHLLGWLDPNRVVEVQASEGEDRTESFVLDAGSLLRIHITPTQGLAVTFDGAGHSDNGARAEPAVFINTLDVGHPYHLKVIDEALPVPNYAQTDTSYFTAGESWAVEDVAPGRALVIEVMEVSSASAQVRIHLGPLPPPVAVFADQFELAPL